MPKTHNIGPKLFFQVTNFPYEWGHKIMVRGFTQEIDEPFRKSKPLILRLPKYKALVWGIWGESLEEEEALNGILESRELVYEDFTEEAGWTPPSDQSGTTSSDAVDTRPNLLDGAVDVHDWKTYYNVAEKP